ncbi:hypothetical protein KSS87_005591, partial [Heliosperma pusillum]
LFLLSFSLFFLFNLELYIVYFLFVIVLVDLTFTGLASSLLKGVSYFHLKTSEGISDIHGVPLH